MKLTKEIFESVSKASKMEYQYSPGGFPQSGKRRFNHTNLLKVITSISKLNNLKTIIQRAAASKLIFGKDALLSPYSAYIRRGISLGMNDAQLSEIENVTWDAYADIRKDYFPEFKY